jgi:hypothetical protein
MSTATLTPEGPQDGAHDQAPRPQLRTLDEWRELRRNVRRVHPELTGWAHGTLWLGGTPAPLIVDWCRERGLVSGGDNLQRHEEVQG